MRSRVLLVIPVCLIAMSLLAGCGGGGGGAPTGKAVVTIAWPARDALVPVSANSVVLTVSTDGKQVATQTVARPTVGGTSTATFGALAVGAHSLKAAAYPNADGSGVAQSQGTTSFTVTANQSTQVSLSMASTIDHLEVSPSNPSAIVGASASLIVTAKDASGNVVLASSSKITWDSSDHAYATVDTSGHVSAIKPTGATPGAVNITVSDTESGKSATVPFKATSNAMIGVDPSPWTMSVGDTKTFVATVTSAPDTSVDWRVQEGAAGGSIASGGAYTAPASPGAFHIVATSVYDNSKTFVIPVTVQAGNADVTVRGARR